MRLMLLVNTLCLTTQLKHTSSCARFAHNPQRHLSGLLISLATLGGICQACLFRSQPLEAPVRPAYFAHNPWRHLSGLLISLTALGGVCQTSASCLLRLQPLEASFGLCSQPSKASVRLQLPACFTRNPQRYLSGCRSK